MRSPIYRSLLALAVMIAGFSASSLAAVQNRIAGNVRENSRAALVHTVAPRAVRSADLGAAPSSLPLQNMSMRFSMTDAQQAALSQLLIDQQNPASPRYHQWLTPQQFGTQFGLSAADLEKVSSWLTAQGFTVTSTAKSSTFITFSGTVGQAQQAFRTTIHNLSLDGERHMANLTEPTLPIAIAGVVSNISGLNNFRAKPRVQVRRQPANAVHPDNTVTTTNGVAHFIAPGDFYTIYNTAPLISNAINGAGITIAVMGQVDLNADAIADVAAFRAASGLAVNPPTIKLYGTDPLGPTATACVSKTPPDSCNDVDESLLDVEWSGAVAPAANIIFVNSTDVIGTSLVQAIDNNIAPIMTVSYGNCESAYAANEIASLNATFRQANVQGITIFGPSGDDGATDCDSGETSATQGLAVDFPASSPYVTGVGGTMFNEGSGTYWNTTNGTFGGSAKGYIPEAVWNETTIDLASSTPAFGAGGGGASIVFAKPTWQTGPGVPNDFVRDVPDVSLSAAASHDGYLVCAFGSCTNGTYFQTSGSFNVFGGTSAATPSFAGILALIEQQLGGGRLGNINPTLYALAGGANYNSIFHDVMTGNNNSPCTANTPNCPNGGQIGFSAGPGYDQATGLGSVDASVLAHNWTPGAPPTTGALLAATTTITTTTTLPVTAGGTVALSVQVASGAAGATPTGKVQIVVDGAANGTAVALSSGGAASYSLSTTSLSSGTHTVSASYLGDTTYATSLGSMNIDVVSATAPDFTLTPSISTISVAGGVTSTPITFTVTPKNGFVGTVAFSSFGGISGQDQFSVTPATLNVGSGTTSVTIQYAIQPSQGALKNGQLQTGLAHSPHSSHTPWYAVGSGSFLAGLLLLTVPRRRRWGALLAAILSVTAIGASGCGSSSSTVPATVVPSATGATMRHSATITVQVPQAGSTTLHTYTVLISAVGTSSK
ncbi:MAG: protease pro-enzyme activation domain-containing protein [Granulicella sp.]